MYTTLESGSHSLVLFNEFVVGSHMKVFLFSFSVEKKLLRFMRLKFVRKVGGGKVLLTNIHYIQQSRL